MAMQGEPPKPDWQRIAQAKRQSVVDKIPASWRLSEADRPSPSTLPNVIEHITQFLTPHELQITNATPRKILENVHSLNWSSVEVTAAFCHRAALAHQLTKCLVEIRFDEARQQAEDLDAYIRESGRPAGPLHGLPVSLKDRFHIRGLESCCGYVSWLGDHKTENDEGVLVHRLRHAGAILYAKTNIPMSMLIGETTNNIIGSTINPFNRNLSAGGACGGEGALIAMGGSPIGWGTDIAGSIRIPSSFNNLFGLRPSYGRMSASGLATTLPGLPTGGTVIGPMCGDLPSLTMMTKWFINAKTWQDDYEVIDMPWNEERWTNTRSRICQEGQSNGSLVFAVMMGDEAVWPHPSVRRALVTLIGALKQRGYEVITWNPPPHSEAADIFFRILGSTAGHAIREAVNASGETPIPQIEDLFNTASDPSPTSDFWELCEQRERFRTAYHRYWKSTQNLTASRRPVDGVILPTAAHAAAPEQSFTYFAYSAVPSMLDFTTGTVPVTFADPELDRMFMDDPPRPFRSPKDEINYELYQNNTSAGSPVGIQVMGQRLQEEKVLAMMEAVKAALDEYDPLAPQ
ncbi:amidase [Pseudovirgaria hyperparasitica]|uniref:Amidase n=1 Tax=Pseudovirgaria hyperparasitica TaxID=470096 RepID=A0A6A6WDY4_9PEZI|nr:amidase [Pseudovirgaria hyperparasitica]KAF2761032.1 amidase [Pseudovirgaria hyperparasitica]